MYTVILGSIAGIIINSLTSQFSWELETLLETVLCILIFYGSSLQRIKNKDYIERVSTLFEKLNKKITDIPQIDKKFQKALSILYIASLVTSGLLFIIMGLPSINEPGGALAVAGGLACFIIAVVLWLLSGRHFKIKN
jgi:hypothetical protein